MNRYAAAGLLLEASKGKRVLVLVDAQYAVRPALLEFVEAAVALGIAPDVLLTNGTEQIGCPSGGRIRVRSTGHWLRRSLRDHVLDVVFVDHSAADVLRSDERLRRDVVELLGAATASTGGSVVEA